MCVEKEPDTHRAYNSIIFSYTQKSPPGCCRICCFVTAARMRLYIKPGFCSSTASTTERYKPTADPLGSLDTGFIDCDRHSRRFHRPCLRWTVVRKEFSLRAAVHRFKQQPHRAVQAAGIERVAHRRKFGGPECLDSEWRRTDGRADCTQRCGRDRCIRQGRRLAVPLWRKPGRICHWRDHARTRRSRGRLCSAAVRIVPVGHRDRQRARPLPWNSLPKQLVAK